MQIQSFLGTPFQSRTYILYSEDSHEALIIDFGEAKPRIFEFLEKQQLEPQMIILTHGHIDHIAGIGELYQKYKIPIYLHARDMALYQNVDQQAELFQFKKPDKLPEVSHNFEYGDHIPFLESSLQVIETPGHTMGSVCFYNKEEKVLFTGDTLFKGSIGRMGLPGSSKDSSEIIRSIENHLYCLPDETQIYPGHMAYTSIGEEKQNNSFTRFFP